jgi:glycerophosphoryl diester phosphodiesterase
MQALMRRRAAVVVTAIFVVLVCTAGAQTSQVATCSIPIPVAHRGGWADVGRTENTVGAYHKAHARGMNRWETDIRFDKYGTAFLMHDSPIGRTTNGSGWASAVNIGTTTIKMDDGYALSGQTLARLLHYAHLDGATVAIEPKVAPTASQASRVLKLLDRYHMRDRVLFDSFYPANLARLKAAAPNLTYSLITKTAVSPATAKAVGRVVNVRDAVLTRQLVANYHAAGLRVDAWTLNTVAAWNAHKDWGIDRYLSDHPLKLRAWRNTLCS